MDNLCTDWVSLALQILCNTGAMPGRGQPPGNHAAPCWQDGQDEHLSKSFTPRLPWMSQGLSVTLHCTCCNMRARQNYHTWGLLELRLMSLRQTVLHTQLDCMMKPSLREHWVEADIPSQVSQDFKVTWESGGRSCFADYQCHGAAALRNTQSLLFHLQDQNRSRPRFSQPNYGVQVENQGGVKSGCAKSLGCHIPLSS